MTGENYRVVNTKALHNWLNTVAPAIKKGTASEKTLRYRDIIDEKFATHSPNDNVTGIYVARYSVGDGKAQYSADQNVITQDIEFREKPVTDDCYNYNIRLNSANVDVSGDVTVDVTVTKTGNNTGITSTVSVSQRDLTVHASIDSSSTPAQTVYNVYVSYTPGSDACSRTTINSNTVQTTQGTPENVTVTLEGDPIDKVTFSETSPIVKNYNSNFECTWEVAEGYKYLTYDILGNYTSANIGDGHISVIGILSDITITISVIDSSVTPVYNDVDSEGCATLSGPSEVRLGEDYDGIVTPTSYYEDITTAKAIINGTEVGTYDASTGAVHIDSNDITGDIHITVDCENETRKRGSLTIHHEICDGDHSWADETIEDLEYGTTISSADYAKDDLEKDGTSYVYSASGSDRNITIENETQELNICYMSSDTCVPSCSNISSITVISDYLVAECSDTSISVPIMITYNDGSLPVNTTTSEEGWTVILEAADPNSSTVTSQTGRFIDCACEEHTFTYDRLPCNPPLPVYVMVDTSSACRSLADGEPVEGEDFTVVSTGNYTVDVTQNGDYWDITATSGGYSYTGHLLICPYFQIFRETSGTCGSAEYEFVDKYSQYPWYGSSCHIKIRNGSSSFGPALYSASASMDGYGSSGVASGTLYAVSDWVSMYPYVGHESNAGGSETFSNRIGSVTISMNDDATEYDVLFENITGDLSLSGGTCGKTLCGPLTVNFLDTNGNSIKDSESVYAVTDFSLLNTFGSQMTVGDKQYKLIPDDGALQFSCDTPEYDLHYTESCQIDIEYETEDGQTIRTHQWMTNGTETTYNAYTGDYDYILTGTGKHNGNDISFTGGSSTAIITFDSPISCSDTLTLYVERYESDKFLCSCMKDATLEIFSDCVNDGDPIVQGENGDFDIYAEQAMVYQKPDGTTYVTEYSKRNADATGTGHYTSNGYEMSYTISGKNESCEAITMNVAGTIPLC